MEKADGDKPGRVGPLSSFLLWTKVLRVTGSPGRGSMQSGGEEWLAKAELGASNLIDNEHSA